MYYHISKENNLTYLHPKIPDTKTSEGEDNVTPRVCVARTIDDCLRALGNRIKKEQNYFVYGVEVNEVFTPTKEEVPNIDVTKEFWILNEIKCQLLYEIIKKEL